MSVVRCRAGLYTVREGTKVRNVTLANLSHLPEQLIELIRRGLKGEQFVAAGDAFKIGGGDPAGADEDGLYDLVGVELQLVAARSPKAPLASESSWKRDLTPFPDLRRRQKPGFSGKDLVISGVRQGEMKEAMAPSDNIQSLIRRAQAGDRAAFDALIQRHRVALERLIRTRLASTGLKNRIAEEDVFQETLLRAFRKLPEFRWQAEDSFARWIGVIATNLVRSAGRREKRCPLPLLDPDACVDPDNSPSKNARRGERFGRLQQALDSLDPDSRRVLVLVRIKGLPIKEVARELGRTPNAVSILLYRAALKLKENFGDTESLSLPWRPLEDREGDHEPS